MDVDCVGLQAQICEYVAPSLAAWAGRLRFCGGIWVTK